MPIKVDVAIEGDKAVIQRLDKIADSLDKLLKTLKKTNTGIKEQANAINDLADAYNNVGRAASKANAQVGQTTGQMQASWARRVIQHHNSMGAPPILDPKAAASTYLARARGASIGGNSQLAQYWLKMHNQAVGQNKDPDNHHNGGDGLTKVLRNLLWSVSPSGHVNWARFAARSMGGVVTGAGGAGMATKAMALVTNPLTIAVAVLVGSFVGLALAAKKANDSLLQWNLALAHNADTGSGLSTTRAKIIAGTLGLGEGSAARFGENIRKGSAAGFAAGAGINPVGGPFGELDYGSKFSRYAQFVAGSSSYQLALRRAHGVGMPEMANLYWLSPGSKRQLGQVGAGISPQERRSNVEWQFQFSRFSFQWDRFVRALGTPALKYAANALETINIILEKTNALVGMGALAGGGGLDVINKLTDLFNGGSKAGGGLKQSMDDLNDSTQELGRIMKDQREFVGGDRRTRGSIPTKLNWKQIQDIADRRMKINLGIL